MTGFGEASRRQAGLVVSVEIRTINSRYLKLSLRTSDGCGSLEPHVDAMVRKRIRRGTIQVNLRVDRAPSAADYRINTDVIEGYRRQLDALRRDWDVTEPFPWESLLALPGVVSEGAGESIDLTEDWPVIRDTLQAALESLQKMRIDEGRAMAADLRANCQAMKTNLEAVQQRAPRVVEAYRARLEERLNKALAELDAAIDPADVLKEVALFADRSDISEEITRLRSHLDQFEAIMQSPESSGRKLEFLTQEMVREVNTIGSKANDVEISQKVIEIKAAAERIREMIQNVE
jgi:uncharacterized protein (TIGR00255 family)